MIITSAPQATRGVTTLMHVGHDGLGDSGLGGAAKTFGYISAAVGIWALYTGDKRVARKVAPWAVGGIVLGMLFD